LLIEKNLFLTSVLDQTFVLNWSFQRKFITFIVLHEQSERAQLAAKVLVHVQ